MKTKTRMIVGAALVLASAVIGQAGPSPDLMNSAMRLRLEAQRNSKSDADNPGSACGRTACWSWSHTRQITAGQSSVAVPDLLRTSCGKEAAREFIEKK